MAEKTPSCNGDCEHCEMRESCKSGVVPEAMLKALKDIQDSLANISPKILILSGKGGVGKSTLTYLLAHAFANETAVGVLDLDLCGPSLPLLFRSSLEPLNQSAFGFEPRPVCENISLISSQFFLENPDDSISARGPAKSSIILQFLRDTDWHELEMLLIDTPPGTSDEHLTVVSLMKEAGIDGAVIVTTSEEIALADVRREINFCQKAGIRILGIIENMGTFICPKCGETSPIYPSTTGGAQSLCTEENGIPFLGSLPIDPAIIGGCLGDSPLSDGITTTVSQIKDKIMELLG